MKFAHPNSMTYWWPRVKDVEVCKPYTYMVEWDMGIYWDLLGVVDGPEAEGAGAAYATLEEIAAVALAYARHLIPPVFIRGCQTSGKHDWEETCFFTKETIADRMAFSNQIANLICDHESKFWLSGDPMLGLAIREFIPSTPIFFTFHGNMPVTKERRMFYVKDEGIVCNHPYWPHAAIGEWERRKWGESTLPKDWVEQLDEMNYPHPHEIRTLESEVEAVGRALVSDEFPAWSIDFLYGSDGNWYFIDCATAPESYHWENCPNKERFERGKFHHLTNPKERSGEGC